LFTTNNQYLDFGTTKHMTPKGEWIKSYNQFASPTMVYVRDEIIGIGKVLIKLKLGLTIEVQDVGLVKLVKKIIIVGQINPKCF